MGKGSTPPSRSTPRTRSRRSIRSHRVGQGQTLADWRSENGLDPPPGLKDEHEKFERMRAEAMASGKKPYCIVCRSGSILYRKDGLFQCAGTSTSRGKPSCGAQGLLTVFTAKEAKEAGRFWLSDLRSAPE